MKQQSIKREKAQIYLEFFSIIFAYEESTFILSDADELTNHSININIFEKYHEIWISFCKRWETKKHIVKPEQMAFYQYVFHDEIDVIVENGKE